MIDNRLMEQKKKYPPLLGDSLKNNMHTQHRR